MAESICAPDAPPSAPTLATMAVAAGAAVLAGVMLGRKGLAGIAVAAFAGAKWYTGTRSTEPAAVHEHTSAVVDLSPEVHPPQEECADWVDHDAVEFCHVVPDTAQAAEMLQEKSLPLLDDDGQPVDFIYASPASLIVDSLIVDTAAVDYPDVPEAQFPLGPIIWKPGRFPQSASAGTSETVWFGMQDVTPAPPVPQSPPPLPAPAPPEPVAADAPLSPEPAPLFAQVISEPAPPPPAAQSIVEEATPTAPPLAVPPPFPTFVDFNTITLPKQQSIVEEAPAPTPAPWMAGPTPGPTFVGLDAITRPKQVPAPAVQNPFFAPVALPAEPAASAPSAITAIPFSTHPQQVSVPPAQNPFLAPAALHAEPAPSAPLASTSTALPFSSGAFGASPVSFVAAADAAAAPVVTAKPAAKASLPQRRRPGELPKHMAGRPPETDPAFPAASLSEQSLPLPWHARAHSAQGVVCAEPAPPPQRHLERFAPVESEPEESRWPLLVLLCLIIALGLAVVADRWYDRAPSRKVEALPLSQKPGEVNHAPTPPAASAPPVATPPVATPAAFTPPAATQPAKRGTWIDPAPAPEPVK